MNILSGGAYNADMEKAVDAGKMKPEECAASIYCKWQSEKSQIYLSSHHQPYRACEQSTPQKASRFDGVGGDTPRRDCSTAKASLEPPA